MRVATIVYYNTALVYYILYIWEVDAHTYYLRTYTHTLAHAHGSNKFDFRCYPTDNNNFTKYILPKNVPLFRFPRVFHHWLLQSAESRAYTVKSSTRRRRCVRVQATIRWRDDIRSDPPQPAADQLYNIKLYSIHHRGGVSTRSRHWHHDGTRIVIYLILLRYIRHILLASSVDENMRVTCTI